MSFTADIIKVLRKHQKITDDAGILTNELIQIACGMAFEFIGEEKGKEDLINKIEACYQHAKKNPLGGKA
jgi:hypothetical protein